MDIAHDFQSKTREPNSQVGAVFVPSGGPRSIPKERPKPPTLSEFKNTFNEWVKSDRPKSFLFYSGIYEILLECTAIKDLPLDEIQEPQGEQMKFWALKRVSKTTVNRYIATPRKALRYACNTLHLTDKAPVIKQFPVTKMLNDR